MFLTVQTAQSLTAATSVGGIRVVKNVACRLQLNELTWAAGFLLSGPIAPHQTSRTLHLHRFGRKKRS